MVESVGEVDEILHARTYFARAREDEMLPLPQMDNYDAELNRQFANEKSRTVKMCMLKNRCILMFTFMLLSFLQLIYICFREVSGEDAFKKQLITLVEKVVEIVETQTATPINESRSF
jgi:hypothetical protein